MGKNRHGEYGKRKGPGFPYIRGFRITQIGGGGGGLGPVSLKTEKGSGVCHVRLACESRTRAAAGMGGALEIPTGPSAGAPWGCGGPIYTFSADIGRSRRSATARSVPPL
jgi:hypothetical protein